MDGKSSGLRTNKNGLASAAKGFAKNLLITVSTNPTGFARNSKRWSPPKPKYRSDSRGNCPTNDDSRSDRFSVDASWKSCSMAWIAVATELPYPDSEFTTAGAGSVCGVDVTAAPETA